MAKSRPKRTRIQAHPGAGTRRREHETSKAHLRAWYGLALILAGTIAGASGCAPDSDRGQSLAVFAGSSGVDNGDAGSGGSDSCIPGATQCNSPSTPVSTAGAGGGGSASSGSGCKAGIYRGGFTGAYRSPAAVGIPLIVASADDPVRGPGLELTLEESGAGCPPLAEFCFDFVVSSGKISGVADPLSFGISDSGEGSFLNVAFEIDLTGELDCSRGVFRGQLENGRYNAVFLDFFFSGTLEATYDSETASFVDGTWEVLEDDQGAAPPPDGFGGEGTWHATHEDS